VAGLEPPDVAEERPGAAAELERQVLLEAVPVELRLDQPAGDQRLGLAGEAQAPGVEMPVERLDAEAVARREQAPPARVPEGEAEHPVEPPEARLSQVLVEMEDDLGVAPRPEDVAARQLVAEVVVVVDLAVEDEPERPVLVRHGLPAGVRIDDGKPRVTQDDAPLAAHPMAVGPAMGEGRQHRRHGIAVGGPVPLALDDARDPAHRGLLPGRLRPPSMIPFRTPSSDPGASEP
jgi:hypothetical protein